MQFGVIPTILPFRCEYSWHILDPFFYRIIGKFEIEFDRIIYFLYKCKFTQLGTCSEAKDTVKPHLIHLSSRLVTNEATEAFQSYKFTQSWGVEIRWINDFFIEWNKRSFSHDSNPINQFHFLLVLLLFLSFLKNIWHGKMFYSNIFYTIKKKIFW